MMRCRGIRGATTVERNDAEEMLGATRELLAALIEANQIEVEDVASVIFTTTPDLTAVFPAVAARDEGWDTVALICGHEMAVPGALDHAIRVLIHWNTEKTASEIRHVYLRRAVELRPEWAYRPGQALQGLGGNGSRP
ncbi:MAG TPA: chorismate mutase [Nitrolancea sp.]|nr:chorismate mutase [Nitrolancea sp.]